MRLGFILVALLASNSQVPVPAPKVGPPRGAIMAVGGSVVPDILARFIKEAGGPGALILVVPTAGLDNQSTLNDGLSTGGQPALVTDRSPEIIARWKAAGAKNVQVLHTRDRTVADSDTFVEPIKKAGGVWFDGGMPEQIINSYAGTKTDQEFRNVLNRGGVLGGTSAGAVALGNIFTNSLQRDFNNLTTGEGFGILRGVTFNVHARVPNPGYLASHSELIRLAMPEPTAWLVREDIAEVVGTGAAFVYTSASTYLTLRPGDQYNLATREVRRAIDGSPLTEQFVDSLFSDFAKPGSPEATVLVAYESRLLLSKSYNIPPHPQNIPTTVAPTFTLGGIADAFNAIAVQLLAGEGKLSLDVMKRDRATIAGLINENAAATAVSAKSPHEAFFRQSVLGGVGSLIDPNRVSGDIATGEFVGSVDPLRTWEMRLAHPHVFGGSKPLDTTFGWQKDTFNGVTRLSLFGTPTGKRHAFVRIPERDLSIIILTNKEDLDARAIAERISARLLATR
jgi:cyanophycinase